MSKYQLQTVNHQSNSRNIKPSNNSNSHEYINQQQLMKHKTIKQTTQKQNFLVQPIQQLSIQDKIKQYLKMYVYQKDYIKKLMISCILSTLYIEQNNYQQSYKLLVQIQKTFQQIEKPNNKKSSYLNEQNQLELQVIKIKMYTNFILIEIINLQVENFQFHLNQVLKMISGLKSKNSSNNSLNQNNQNVNPNLLQKNNQDLTSQRMTLLFKLLLKGLSGFQSFQQIQTYSLIAQCNMDSQKDMNKYFYYSNISFLKLLSQDPQTSYKLQFCSYQIIQSDITQTKKKNQQLSLKQVILKTISLKKLIYLCQLIELPNQILKNYKQELYSTQCLKSKYLSGLQQNTIFRNYNQKINLGFKLVRRLKQFEKQYIFPIYFYEQSKRTKQSLSSYVNKQKSNNIYELWEYKALRNKLVQYICSSQLEENQQVKLNLYTIIKSLDKGILLYKNSKLNQLNKNKYSLEVEQKVLLQNLKNYQVLVKNSNKKSQKQQSFSYTSLYKVALSEYQTIVNLLVGQLQKVVINNAFKESFSKIHSFYKLNKKSLPNPPKNNQTKPKTKKPQPQNDHQQQDQQIQIQNIQIIKNHKQHRHEQNRQSQQEDEQSLDLDVQVQLIESNHNPYEYQINRPKYQINKTQLNHKSNVVTKNRENQNKYTPTYEMNKINKQYKQQKLSQSQNIQKKYISFDFKSKNTQAQNSQSYKSHNLEKVNPLDSLDSRQRVNLQIQKQKQNKKNVLIIDKNQNNLNYTELGSRVKLNQGKSVNTQIDKNQNQVKQDPKNYGKKYMNINVKKQKKVQFFESINSQEGQISIPNQQSVVKYGGKKYPFQQKNQDKLKYQKYLPYQTNQNILQDYKKAQKKYDFVQNSQTFQRNLYKNENTTIYDQIQTKNKLKKYTNLDNKNDSKMNQFKYQSRISEQLLSMTQTQNRKSKQKKSSLSPKHTTINSRLNQHVVHHDVNYSPNVNTKSKRNLLEQTQFNKQQKNQSFLSNLNFQQEKSKQKSKSKNKIQKANYSTFQNQRYQQNKKHSYSKSKAQNSTYVIPSQVIKYKDFIQNLQKSGISIKDEPTLNKNSSKSKIQSKGKHLSSKIQNGHRRIFTQDVESHSKFQQNNELQRQYPRKQQTKNILEYFLTETPKQKSNLKFGKQFFKQSPKQKIKPTVSDNQFDQSPNQSVYHENQVKKQSIKKKVATQSENNLPMNKKPPMIKPPLSVGAKQGSEINQKGNSRVVTQNNFLIPLSPSMVGDYVLKMMKSHQQKLKQKIRLCKNGQYVDKKHYTSDGGQQRFLQLSADQKYIQWAANEEKLISGNKKKYEISLIKGVVYGKVTQTMRKQFNKVLQPYKCISLIFQKRTFDIYCAQQKDIRFWLPGISYCISQARPALTHPNYTKNIQKFIKRKQSHLKKDEFHQLPGYYSLGRVLWRKALLKMQHLYLAKNKKTKYRNLNAGAIIQFHNATKNNQRNELSQKSILPPTGKQKKKSKQKSISILSKGSN